ncbi:hypothetical protein OCS_01907 [Ophiocordyceps sinensis CO18]|uniref:Uncharacterized protein n=1 Tax=Ophiocordyceps sinensis (strain Co18 / CGMCC 3.14243) TaxID=911162 RepID=T5AIF6_OPHSC|nr:hypothetical protein OCS_01907 [Ophiocordyceps sinensis CO18]
MSIWLDTAHGAWSEAFLDGPFTSLKMVQYLLSKSGTTYEEYVAAPKLLDRVSEQAIREDESRTALRRTWASKTGRCTSFAIKVSTRLDQHYPGVFDFQIYDLKGHRVARCHKTGILIDSSSRQGAIRLREGEWISSEDGTQNWKWIDGKSKFETSRGLVSHFVPDPRCV